MMHRFAMYGKTETDNFYEWLTPFLPWVTTKAEASTSDDLIRIRNYSLQGLVQPILKKTICADQKSVITGRIHKLSEVAGNKLEKCELHPSLENQVADFSSTSKADWLIDSFQVVAALKFEELDCPVVFVRTEIQTAQNSFSSTVVELICARTAFDRVVSYLQQLEQEAAAIILQKMEGGTTEISPLSWDGVVLDQNIDEMVRQDFISFLTPKKKKWFNDKGLPYRRGYLFHGPPGNGKTSLIRSMLTHARLPAYTMKNFASNEAMWNFEHMFEEASKNEEAIIVLEDIDRSFSSKGNEKDSDTTRISFSTFLNCLDGVGNREGLILIATANNPRNLDMAVLERPGRFDRVVGFPNATEELRLQYFMRLTPFDEDKLRDALHGSPSMSFAQLKETYILAYQFAEKANREDIVEEDLLAAIKAMTKMLSVKAQPIGIGMPTSEKKTGF
jgi:AAA+ superfamily predicted ATPase